MSRFEPPIQNLDAFDIVGRRKDGGIDLVVVCSGPLDASSETLGLIEGKVNNYLQEVRSETFKQQFGTAPIAIFLSCEYSVSEAAMNVVDRLTTKAKAEGVALRLVEKMAQPGIQPDGPASGGSAG